MVMSVGETSRHVVNGYVREGLEEVVEVGVIGQVLDDSFNGNASP